MWNEPSPDDLERLPRLYETEHIKLEHKILHMRFYFGRSDWYDAEYDAKVRHFLGYVILNDDLPNAEWGYFGYAELRGIKLSTPIGVLEVDRDLLWQPKTWLETVKESDC